MWRDALDGLALAFAMTVILMIAAYSIHAL